MGRDPNQASLKGYTAHFPWVFELFLHSTLTAVLVMSNPKKPASLFGDDDDDDEGLPKARAKRAAAAKGEDNPLSFFSFGSAAVAPAASSKATSAAKSLFGSDDEDDDDDEFFKSPPGSLKKPVKKAASSSFDLSDEDEIELPRDGSNGSLLSTLSFKAAVGVSGDRPASAEPSRSTGAGAGTENLRIVALEEQLVKANKTIKKLQDKAKSVRSELMGEHLHRSPKSDQLALCSPRMRLNLKRLYKASNRTLRSIRIAPTKLNKPHIVWRRKWPL